MNTQAAYRLYCGTSGWNYNDWRGRFYPENLPQSEWLEYYSRVFDTVEINNSFYRLPEISTFEKWRFQTPDNFTFAVKASRYLTHIKRLKDPEEPLERLLAHSSGLADKRGPVLYQFPPNWRMNLERLEAFLKILPRDVRHVFEFRDDSWHNDEVWSMLSRYSAAYCVMDAPGLPQHMKITADFAYIRMHSGGEATHSNYTRGHLTSCAHHIEDFLARGDTYIYFNNDYNAYAVENALSLRKMLSVA
ncbi:MAG: DUF72 domain-containing protein [Armatimonadota bacterium]|nr:DUF72 domain-containing protein [bacterium]